MATYSRTTSTIQTSQAQPQVASKDLGNFVVKSLENLMNENKGEDDKYEKNDDYLKDIQDTITKGIDSSQLVKENKSSIGRKDPLTGSGMASLLVNRNASVSSATSGLLVNRNTDSSSNSKNNPMLGLLQKQTTETRRESVKSEKKHIETKKLFGTVAKHLSPANIGKVLIGTFTVAGITGMTKKFGTIALGLVVGLATLSQVAVLLKAAWYSIKANWPAEKIKIGAKIHGWLAALPGEILLGLKKLSAEHLLPWMETLPERISNMFAQLFDKFKIGEHGLSKEEQKELKALKKETDNYYDSKDFKKRKKSVLQMQTALSEVDYEQYDLQSKEGRQAYIQAQMDELDTWRFKDLNPEERQERMNAIQEQLAALDELYEKLPEEQQIKLARLSELEAKAQNPYDKDARDKELALHEAEARTKWIQKLGVDDQSVNEEKARLAKVAEDAENAYVEKAVYNASARGEGLSEYTTERLKQAGYSAQIQNANAKLVKDNIDIKTKAESKEEHWLKNEFEDWKNSWKQFGSDFAKDIGIRIQQVPAPARNPSTESYSNR